MFFLDVEPGHGHLWEAAGEVGEFFSEANAERDLNWCFDRAVIGLAANYRVSAELVSALDLLNSTNWRPVLAAMIDFPFMLEELRKR